MKPTLLTYLLLLALPLAASAQEKDPFNPNEKISADSARRNFSEIIEELKKKHPGFYRYHAKPAFDHYIDSVSSTIQTPQDQMSYYRKIKPVFAHIGCLHTGISLSAPYQAYLNESTNLFPLRLYFKDDQAFITANYSGDPAIPIGSEIVLINQKPIKEIKALLFAAIPSDGYNTTLKYQLLNHQFAQWYRSILEVTDKFAVTINTPAGRKDLALNGISSSVIPVSAIMDRRNEPRLDFSIKDTPAVLTIHSFAKTEIKLGQQDFKKFIKNAFEKLKDAEVKRLIIDLRDNSGGTDANAAYLCAFLMNKPFRYWNRIEVTKPLAQSIKGISRLVYRKPVKQDSIYLWRKSPVTSEFDFYELQQPKKNAFNGKVYILINGLCMSSCSDLAAVLQYNKRAVFIGEETGGGYQGNNSGLMPEVKLAFGLTATVPLLKYVTAVDPKLNIGHGTYPDIPYRWDIKDVISQIDAELEASKALIAER